MTAMKIAILGILILLTGYLADRVVRIENQRYALLVNMCKFDPANATVQWNCLEKAQTRTSWLWHLYYALTDHVPLVPLFSAHSGEGDHAVRRMATT
jgi:hypothetical protein